MRRLTIALLAACLLGTSTVPALAQETSPPPWFGGRVEMPEHGFAVTIPEDWMAFDLGADTEPVKPDETRRHAMLCPSTSLGLLIQAGPGSFGGVGGLLTKRSGWAA